MAARRKGTLSIGDILRDHRWVVSIMLALVTLVAFSQVIGSEFVNYDDDGHVTENPYVQKGLSWESAKWAFSTTYTGIWHPLTWLSHMADYQVYRLNPTGHHLTSLVLHVLNALILFLVLGRLTGSMWRSCFVAALFAVHPLRVESVAWVAERKDVLSTFFWLLTMWAYVRYVQSPGVKTYAPVLLLFALGLMSKPMLVTLPFILLLLDYWPLGRVGAYGVGAKHLQGTSSKAEGHRANALPLRSSTSTSKSKSTSKSTRILVEKIPLLLLGIAGGLSAVYAEKSAETMRSLVEFPLTVRLANALVACVKYILMTLWPRGLAVFYPHPGRHLATWEVALSAAVLLGLTILIVWSARRRPWLGVGWLWYLITLAPVIGLLQVGNQAMADRYTYVPLIGLFLMLAWGIPELMSGRMSETEKGRMEERRKGRTTIPPFLLSSFLPFSAAVVLLTFTACTWVQVGYWKDSSALFRHALAVTRGNYLAHNDLGIASQEDGDIEAAEQHYRRAIAIKPDYGRAHFNLAVILEGKGDLQGAIREYRAATRSDANQPAAHNNLGVLLKDQGKLDEAIREYRKAIRLQPDFVQARSNLAVAQYFAGDYVGAWEQVHACERHGFTPPSDFLDALSKAMPEPWE